MKFYTHNQLIMSRKMRYFVSINQNEWRRDSAILSQGLNDNNLWDETSSFLDMRNDDAWRDSRRGDLCVYPWQ